MPSQTLCFLYFFNLPLLKFILAFAFQICESLIKHPCSTKETHSGHFFLHWEVHSLGLLIVRRIVREHGGEIEVDSEEGRGTRISLFFPRGEKRVRLLEDEQSSVIEV